MKKYKRVFGLDVGFTTGWCSLDLEADEVEMGEITAAKDEFINFEVAKLVELEMEKFKPDFVVIEGYSYGGAFTNFNQPEITGQIKRFLYDRKIPFICPPPTSLKLEITGSGKAQKSDVKKAVRAELMEYFVTDMIKIGVHAADAGQAALLGMRISLGTLQRDPEFYLSGMILQGEKKDESDLC